MRWGRIYGGCEVLLSRLWEGYWAFRIQFIFVIRVNINIGGKRRRMRGFSYSLFLFLCAIQIAHGQKTINFNHELGSPQKGHQYVDLRGAELYIYIGDSSFFIDKIGRQTFKISKAIDSLCRLEKDSNVYFLIRTNCYDYKVRELRADYNGYSLFDFAIVRYRYHGRRFYNFLIGYRETCGMGSSDPFVIIKRRHCRPRFYR